jgi:hypothetical protein
MAGFISRLAYFKKWEEKDKELHSLSSTAFRFAQMQHFYRMNFEKCVIKELLRASLKTSRELQKLESTLAKKFMNLTICFAITLGALSRRKIPHPHFIPRVPIKLSPRCRVKKVITSVETFQKVLEKWLTEIGEKHVFYPELKNYELHCLGLILNSGYIHDHIVGNFGRKKLSYENVRKRERQIYRQFLEKVKIIF